MIAATLFVFICMLLVVGLLLHGVYIESESDLPCRPSKKRRLKADLSAAPFFSSSCLAEAELDAHKGS